MNPIIPQMVGIAAVITFLLSYQQKSRMGIIILNTVSRLLYIIQYFLLGAFSGAVLDILGAASGIVAGKKGKEGFVRKYYLQILIAIDAVIIGAGIALYENIFSIFPIVGVLLHTSAFWIDDEKIIRRVSLAGSPFWMVYNVSSRAYGSAVGDGLTIASIIIAMIKYSRSGVNKNENNFKKGDIDMAENKVDLTALFNIGYGLYVVTARDGDKDNGMIANSIMQVTNTPARVAVTLNNGSYTCEMIKKSGKMNVNCLSTEAPFKVFEAFGFVSGRDKNKFEQCTPPRSENGIVYLPHYINAYISLDVEQVVELGTHTMFICGVSEASVVSSVESMTYAYYHKNVKPKPKVEKKKGYICKICGFIHDEEELPEDYICPICGHGSADFEPIT